MREGSERVDVKLGDGSGSVELAQFGDVWDRYWRIGGHGAGGRMTDTKAAANGELCMGTVQGPCYSPVQGAKDPYWTV